MGMTIEDCIHKLDFFIGAYQKLIDENVANGEVVGTGVRGTWTASTPLNKAYSNMIEALQIAKDTLRKYQQLQADYEARLKADMVAMLEDLRLDFQEAELAGVLDNKELIFADEVDDLVQQKINELKGDQEGKNDK